MTDSKELKRKMKDKGAEAKAKATEMKDKTGNRVEEMQDRTNDNL